MPIATKKEEEQSDQVDCPILKEWMKMDSLVERAGRGKIAEIVKLPLTRETVADNADILAPVIAEYGILASNSDLLSSMILTLIILILTQTWQFMILGI